jgi:hypothetical protein
MAIRLNQQAVEYAQNLIKGWQYERNSDWSEAQPSAQEENNFIDANGWKRSRNGTWRCCKVNNATRRRRGPRWVGRNEAAPKKRWTRP